MLCGAVMTKGSKGSGLLRSWHQPWHRFSDCGELFCGEAQESDQASSEDLALIEHPRLCPIVNPIGYLLNSSKVCLGQGYGANNASCLWATGWERVGHGSLP